MYCFRLILGDTITKRLTLYLLFYLLSIFVSFAQTPEHVDGLKENKKQENLYRMLDLYAKIIAEVQESYIYDPDLDKMVRASIKGLLSSLDPHSNYYDSKKAKELMTVLSDEFSGIGIKIENKDKKIIVVSPIDDTPAKRAGIMSGDIITYIDGKSTTNMSLDNAVDLMTGEPGTSVKIVISRSGIKTPLNFNLVRSIIQLSTVSQKVKGKIGYLQISSFSSKTYRDLLKSFNEIKAKLRLSLKGLILDLRNNSGGFLDACVQVADAFIDRGEIVSIKGRSDDDNNSRYFAHKGDITGGIPIVILINGGTASASEVLAGALRDQHRAKIIGTRSFGKGSVQSIISLGKDLGVLKLTTALYYTPSGESIQAKGIVPDFVINQHIPDEISSNYYDVSESSLTGHLKGSKEYKGSSTYIPKTDKDDKQLEYALAYLNGTLDKLKKDKTKKNKDNK